MASTSIEVKYEDGTDDRYFILTHPILFINPIILDDMKRKGDVDCFMAMRKSLIFRGYILLQYLCNDLLSPMKYFNLESFDVGIVRCCKISYYISWQNALKKAVFLDM